MTLAEDARSIVDKRLGRLVARTPIRGMVVGLTGRSEDAVFAYGESGTGRVPRLDGEALFESGSIAKTLTGTLLAEMVTRGEVQLTDSIRRFLPDDLNVPTPIGRITLLELATHRSHLPREARQPECEAARERPYPKTVEGLYEIISNATLRRRRPYSNLGFILLAHVLGRAARSEFSLLLKERILKPLQMAATGPTTDMPDGRFVQGFGLVNGEPIGPYLRLPGSGAGVWTNANDMIRWLRANLYPDATPLAEALHMAQRPHASAWPRPLKVGLDWATQRSGIVFHLGGTFGFSSYCGFLPASETGIIVLANAGVGELRPRARIVFLRHSLRLAFEARRTLMNVAAGN